MVVAAAPVAAWSSRPTPATVNGLTIHANGGNGTDAWPTGATGAANYHGPGGGGGGGVIITSNALPAAQTSVLGGVHGTTTVDLNTFGSVSGSAGLVADHDPGRNPRLVIGS